MMDLKTLETSNRRQDYSEVVFENSFTIWEEKRDQ